MQDTKEHTLYINYGKLYREKTERKDTNILTMIQIVVSFLFLGGGEFLYIVLYKMVTASGHRFRGAIDIIFMYSKLIST